MPTHTTTLIELFLRDFQGMLGPRLQLNLHRPFLGRIKLLTPDQIRDLMAEPQFLLITSKEAETQIPSRKKY